MFQIMYGGVICVVGDIPTSNFIGRFKKGVGYLVRKCRIHNHCYKESSWFVM